MSGERDFEKLRRLAYKLRCIGYFFENQGPIDGCPLDFEEVQYGLALILNEITDEMISIAENMGEKPEKSNNGELPQSSSPYLYP